VKKTTCVAFPITIFFAVVLGFAAFANGQEAPVVSVSYTHLDVYKRQGHAGLGDQHAFGLKSQ